MGAISSRKSSKVQTIFIETPCKHLKSNGRAKIYDNSAERLDDFQQTSRTQRTRASDRRSSRRISTSSELAENNERRRRRREMLEQAPMDLRQTASEPDSAEHERTSADFAKRLSMPAYIYQSFHTSDSSEVIEWKEQVAEELERTKSDAPELRKDLFLTLCLNWHASRHEGAASKELAKFIYQYLLDQREWYLGLPAKRGHPPPRAF